LNDKTAFGRGARLNRLCIEMDQMRPLLDAVILLCTQHELSEEAVRELEKRSCDSRPFVHQASGLRERSTSNGAMGI